MIIVEHPFIEKKEKETFLKAVVKDVEKGNEFTLWFSVDSCYGEYLCDDRADAFLLAVLMIAMKNRQDITINAPVSKKLLFHINNTIQPLFTKMIPGSRCVSINVSQEICSILEGKAVGCGCSLGVDSLSSLYKHMGNEVIDGYQVTHLAMFNSGQFGYLDKEINENSFRKGVESIVPFSEETNLPIVAVNTNENELFVNGGFFNASSRFIISTLCCPMALQKLFGKYVFASSYSVEDFEIQEIDQSHAEAAFVPLLSTESTEIILSSAVMTRVEKTDFIRKNPLTPKYLDVCWAAQMASGDAHNDKWVKDKTKKNCGWCDKCLRTLYTLELLGEDLTKYKDSFDLEKYYAHKDKFIRDVLLLRKKNIMKKEIYELMLKKNYVIPKQVKREIWKLRAKALIRRILGK